MATARQALPPLLWQPRPPAWPCTPPTVAPQRPSSSPFYHPHQLKLQALLAATSFLNPPHCELCGPELPGYFCLFFKYMYSFFLLLAALGLCCYRWGFSSCREQGLLSSCGAQASLCGGFSCCGAQVLGHAGSAVWAQGLSSYTLQALEHGLRSGCPTACEIFPDQGSNLHPLHW